MTIKYIQEIGHKYPSCGYGGVFGQWIFSKNPKPYNSFCDGALLSFFEDGFILKWLKRLKAIDDSNMTKNI